MFNGTGLAQFCTQNQKKACFWTHCALCISLGLISRPRLKETESHLAMFICLARFHFINSSNRISIVLIFPHRQKLDIVPCTRVAPGYCLAVLCYIHTSTCLLIYSPTDGNEAISSLGSYEYNCSVGSFTRTLFLWWYIFTS